MRSTIVNFLAAALVVFGTTVAGALSFTVTQIGGATGSLVPGDTIDLELTIDASDLVGLGGATSGYGISILIEGDATWGTVLIADGGVGFRNPAQFQVDFGGSPALGTTLAGTQEPSNAIFGNVVIMATFTADPPVGEPQADYSNALNGNIVARVTLELLTPGLDATVFLASGAGPGDGFDFSLSSDILGDFTQNGINIDIVPIPEPGTALLMALGLIGLSAAGRRR